MAKLAKLLTWCFALEAIFFAALFSFAVDTLLRYRQSWTAPLPAGRAAFAALILAIPLALAVVLLMPLWTTLRRKSSARAWAIAASAVSVFVSAGLGFLFFGTRGPNLWINWLPAAFGTAGLIVFSRRHAPAQMHPRPAALPRLPGDGTSRFVDALTSLGCVALALLSIGWWERWSRASHLPLAGSASFVLMIFLATVISLVAHEFGHAGAGIALGMKLCALDLGPLHWRLSNGKWQFRFSLAGSFFPAGRAHLVPIDPAAPPSHDVLMFAGGPASSLCLGLLALWAALTAKGRPWERSWELFALIAVLSLLAGAANLIPARPHSFYSDGANMYHLLRRGPLADVYRSFSIFYSSTVTPLRPRDYDIQAIQRAANFLTQGQMALSLRLMASTYFFDCSRNREALDAIADAESVFDQSPPDIPAEMLAEFVFANAFLKRDPARARLWWDRVEAKKPSRDSVDYWLALSSLHWIENRPDEARQAWAEGNARAQQLPQAGACEFDRFRFARLSQALAAPPPQPVPML